MESDQQLRNLRDFLMVYNRMTDICFQRCTSNFNYRNLTMDEERCVDSCAGKLIRSNHRLMGTYVQLMPQMVQRRMEEIESKAAENAKAAEAAAAAAAAQGPAATDTSVSPMITLSPPAEVPAPFLSSVTDAGPEAHGSVLQPAGLGVSFEVDAAVSQSAAATEVKLFAAAPLTPATEAVNPAGSTSGGGPSYSAGFPQLPTAAVQIESRSSGPVLMPSIPTSSSEDVSVLTVSAPTASSPARAPEVPPLSGQ
ncbi:mitochondrial import inner membrane translocase subunit Tim10 B [Scophthalmus maximus]|uniref:mitochondrial import inner membrane translocase subunit Tim10 B n=1 Tax=Scophthalmus maximus TaxID=52904 RepID=UPI000F314219|nr:mitochondrial import inner membrane translocase subunit Tim10 B [Scophthalmus maximus]